MTCYVTGTINLHEHDKKSDVFALVRQENGGGNRFVAYNASD